MSKRHNDAQAIWFGGASNPRAVVRALLSATDEAAISGSDAAKDPAVQMILDHLCFLCGLPQPSMSMGVHEWDIVVQEVEFECLPESVKSSVD